MLERKFMINIILKEDDITDIDYLDEYFEEYKKIYPDFKPYTTKETYIEFLKDLELKKQGINNNGIKEIFYYAYENNKIIGHGSIRLNPETDKNIYEEAGHIMYGIVPSKRNQGYGKELCRKLLNQANKLGLDNVIITCNINNLGSKKIIEKMGGIYINSIDVNGTTIIRYTVPTLVKEYRI